MFKFGSIIAILNRVENIHGFKTFEATILLRSILLIFAIQVVYKYLIYKSEQYVNIRNFLKVTLPV